MELAYIPKDDRSLGGAGEKYQLIRRIAVGGMAEIFLARAVGIERFEKPVVLKRLLPQFENNAELVAMFLHEARLAAILQHPNIAQVYDIGRKEGAFFFTMEYVHGQTLRAILKAMWDSDTRMPLASALHIGAQLASALHYAHSRCGNDGRPLHIVHRDVSPSNVIVTYDGCVKVVDFGIAKAATQDHQTRSGTLKGKIPYMSPEQCRGEPVDARSDIFSVGTVLFELTTGTRLFGRGNELTVLKQVAEGPIPRPSDRRVGYSPRLEEIVMKALARDLSARYQTADALATDLEQLAAESRLVMSARQVRQLMTDLFGTPPEPVLDAAPQKSLDPRQLPLPPGEVTATTSVSPLPEPAPIAVEPAFVAAPCEPVLVAPPVTVRRQHGLAWATLACAALGLLMAVLITHKKSQGEPAAHDPANGITNAPEAVDRTGATPRHAEDIAPAPVAAPALYHASAPAADDEPVTVQAAEDEPVTVQAAEDEPVTVQAAEDEPVAAKAAPATRTRARKRSAKSHTRRHPREDNTDRSRGHIDSLDFDSSNTRSGVDSLGF